MSNWIDIKDRLPANSSIGDKRYYDIWCSDYGRIADVEFFEDCFQGMILDYQGDYSHNNKIENVTHWMEVPDSPDYIDDKG